MNPNDVLDTVRGLSVMHGNVPVERRDVIFTEYRARLLEDVGMDLRQYTDWWALTYSFAETAQLTVAGMRAVLSPDEHIQVMWHGVIPALSLKAWILLQAMEFYGHQVE
jgi:hypothetical protein